VSLLLLWAGGVFAQTQESQTEKKEVKVNTAAPDFTVKNQDGKDVRLKDYQGKQWVVLAFFPKAATPG
jgi:peroxiredoxin Q/BCP